MATHRLSSGRGSGVTIQDVADLAQVSIKTVSRVLNHEPGVAAKTREAVQAAAQTLRYQPNPAARNLSSAVGNNIGFAFPVPSRREGKGELAYSMALQLGALLACGRLDLGVLLQPRQRKDAAEAAELVELMQGRRISGLVVADPDAHLIQRLQAQGVMFSAINANELEGGYPVVAVDDRPAAERMTAMLIAHGHRRIGFVQGRDGTRVAADRLAGFRAAMATAGLPVDPAWIAQGDFSFDAGLQAGLALLRQAPRVSAIFAANDTMAMGVVHAAHSMGLNVPGDLSAVGFDDLDGVELFWPPLTTIHQPLGSMAEMAVEQLAARMFPHRRDIPARPALHVFACELVERASVAAPPREPP